MTFAKRPAVALALLAMVALLAGCERPPVQSVQRGYRGLGMEQLYNPRTVAAAVEQNQAQAPLAPAPLTGQKASAVFKNVQVLGDVDVGEFTRLMVAITNWVAPQQGCLYCHDGADMSSDALYTKVVSRRMLQMTRQINAGWKSHVAETGVTCFTCHRGQPVPANLYFNAPGPDPALSMAGNRAGQNAPSPVVGYTSLPNDPFAPFLEADGDIRVVSTTALPSGNRHSIKQTEWTYGLMMHMSQALGVNCTYCHNSRSFAAWEASTPQRATAFYGIRLVRALNNQYLTPLAATLPPARHGPNGDGPKVDCATCHNGAYKPLFGASMLNEYPELGGPAAPSAAAAAADIVATVAPPAAVKLYFAQGRAELPAEAGTALAALVAQAQTSGMKSFVVAGYHDASGSVAQNEELAKQRAMAVRDGLRSAGAAEASIELAKPQQTQGGSGADNPEARRVDVTAR